VHDTSGEWSEGDVTDRPCPTITVGVNSVNSHHYQVRTRFEKRKLTIAELKKLCSFPDDFDIRGTYAQQWERCGRAVPPVMMRAVAERVRDALLALDAKGKK
jgi:DNA (cytosine-5)-methyltransferase 1